MRRATAALLGVLLSAPGLASADEDEDLGAIPEEVRKEAKPLAPPAAATTTSPGRTKLHWKFFLEDALAVPSASHAVPVPYPSPLFGIQNRTSLDANLQWEPRPRLRLTLSDRLNVIEQDDLPLVSRQTIGNSLREGYATWEPLPDSYLEAGRVNVRNGVALGFNPTDFFKTRTLVGQASLDPSVVRENRLGTLMARGQTIWSGGSATVAFAPKLSDATTITQSDPLGVDPRFDATNGAYRLLTTLSFELADLSPQALAYFELHRSKVGLNLSRPIGDAVVGYAEWAGGPEQDLIARGVAYGHTTGTLPASAPVLPPTDTATAFRNDLSAGASVTVATKLTLNLEYHFHQAGFSRGDWRRWFDVGSAAGTPATVAGELWYVRGYASDQQEPVAMHQAFVRADWPDAMVKDLELSGLRLA